VDAELLIVDHAYQSMILPPAFQIHPRYSKEIILLKLANVFFNNWWRKRVWWVKWMISLSLVSSFPHQDQENVTHLSLWRPQILL